MFAAASQNPASAAAPANATQAPQGFGFSATPQQQQPLSSTAPPPPAAATATGTRTAASITSFPQPVASAPPQGAAAPTGTQAPPPPPPPPPPDFMTQFQRALDNRALNPSLVAQIKERFTTPYAVKVPAAPAAAPPRVQQTQAYPQQQQQQQQQPQMTPMGGGWGGLGAAPLPNPNAHTGKLLNLPKALPSAGPQQQQRDSHAPSVAAMQAHGMFEWLTVLLACDSGFMNAYDNEVDKEKNLQANKELVTGLHAAVGGIAGTSASAIVSHLKKELSPSALGYDGINAALQGVPRSAQAAASRSSPSGNTLVGIYADTGRGVSHIGSNPLMAGAQCLYLLTRHFQMQPSFVKEALELVECLLSHIQTELSGRRMPHLGHFRDAHETSALCSLTWLVVLSVGNAMAVWKKVRATSGEAVLVQNSLIRSDVATTLGASVAAMKKKFEDAVLASNADAMGKRDDALGFLSRSGARNAAGGAASHASAAATATATALLRSGAAHMVANYRWLAVVEAFLGILTLVEGCMLRAKGDERGFERAVDAFTGGDKASPLSVAFGGKVAKRLVQLAPAPSTLSIPIDYIYIVPYEILSYMFDDMLPAIRHVALLEMDSDRAYLDEVQRLEEAMPLGLDGGNSAISSYGGGGGGGDNSRRVWDGMLSGRRGGGGGGGNPEEVAATMNLPVAAFTTEMANILGCIAECLEHLSPDVLNPDLDADCSVTFFIFRNCVKHMGQVFALQRSGGTALWESFTLVLVSKFLDVLAMIGRNPQYVVRVVAMLTEAQVECQEMQWGSLVNQALECAGFSSTGANSVAATIARQNAAASSGGNPDTNGGSFLYHGHYGNAGGGPQDADHHYQQQQQQQLPRQFTMAFARSCQQQYICSFFMFLRQVFAHPVLREEVAKYMSLELALSFVFAPWQSQLMLGSTLSLISALVATPGDAALVWAFLDTNRLLQPPRFSPWSHSTPTAAADQGYDVKRRGEQAAASSNGGSLPYRDENLSLLGHCLFEGTIGVYSITTGYLNLMISLFRYSVPSTASFALFASMAHFIAEDLFIGVSKRNFVQRKEKYTVISLAAAALRQALAVRFVVVAEGANAAASSPTGSGLGAGGGGGMTSAGGAAAEGNVSHMVIPFATIMAPIKSPADVTSEALKVVYKASSTPYELASHQRAAARQCLQLLTAAIQTVREQQMEVFAFDSRTVQSASLAYHALFLCSANDPLLMRAALELLLQFPRSVMAQATGYWHAESGHLAGVISLFADLLHPLSVAALGSIVRAPPELAILDADPNDPFLAYHQDSSFRSISRTGLGAVALSSGTSEYLAHENRSLLLDLLLQHARNAELSVTVWLCGFVSATAAGSVAGDAQRTNHLADTQMLDSVVAGATSSAMEHASPGLAVKYVKLLYLLRSNRLYGSTLMRGFMESACQDLFLHLQRFRADQCSPVLLSKYAYVLKLLALEALDVHNTCPDHLDVTRMVVPSIPAEVLLSLLHLGRDHNGSSSSADAAASLALLHEGSRYGGELRGYSETTDCDKDGGSGRHASRHPGSEEEDAAVETLPRGLSADMAQWLPQCFSRLANFPTCDPPNGRDRYLIPAARDGIVQFDIRALYEAFQLEQVEHDLPPLTMEDFRVKLGPFIELNQCFLEYASAVNFVEGWCQLLDISCMLVRGISARRLRSFFLCIVRSMNETSRMTLAAQEQVAYHLFSTLTTVSTQLKDRCTNDPEGEEGEAAATAPDGSGGLATTYDRQPIPANARLSLVNRTTTSGGADGTRLAIANGSTSGPLLSSSLAPSQGGRGRRRGREDGIPLGATSGTRSSKRSSIFATQAGDRSNFLGLANRTRLSKSSLLASDGSGDAAATHYGYGNRDIAGDELSFAALMEGHEGGSEVSGAAANQNLLRCLVVAVVRWGSKIPVVRGDAYTSFLCLAQIPGVSADDFVVFRCQDTLFDLIAADITGSSAQGTPTPLGRQRALTLLLQLLQTSPALCDAFCGTTEGGAAGIGQRPLRCAKALLRDVDAVVSSFLADTSSNATRRAKSHHELGIPTISGRSLAGVLLFLRSAFDYLAILSLHHSPQVLQGSLIDACMVMECWDRCSQVAFGRVAPSAAAAAAVTSSRSGGMGKADSASSKCDQDREVVKHLLLGAVRWFNVMQAAIGDAAQFVSHMQEFVRLRRQLIEYVLEMVPQPMAPMDTAGGGAAGVNRVDAASAAYPTAVGAAPLSTALNTASLTLLAETTELLRGLSASPLAEECRALVTEMALTGLLHSISSDAFAQYCHRFVYEDYYESHAPSAGGRNRTTTAAPSPLPASPPYPTPSSTHAAISPHGNPGGASVAARNLDLVALSTRNLAHFLLRSEYGLRAYAENPDAADVEAALPRLRSSPQQIHLVLHITQQVARALEGDAAAALDGGADVSELRLECHLLALHALVCLVHSFVLPLPVSQPEEHIKGFLPYLKSLPLPRMLELLEYCQVAVYKQRDFNADYRTGITGLRTADGSWAVAANSISNTITDGRMSAGGKVVQARGVNSRYFGATKDGSTTEPSTPALSPIGPLSTNQSTQQQQQQPRPQQQQKPTTPSTPLFNAAAGNWLMGTNQQSIEAHHRSAGGRPLPTPASQPSSQSATMAAGSGSGGGVAHTSLLVLDADGQPQQADSRGAIRTARDGGDGDGEREGATAAVAGAGSAPDRTTIGELMTHTADLNGCGNDAWALMASSASALPSWEGVLSMESAVRQVKIAIANALRATSSAMDVVARS